ncbi:MAG: hypothetical protein RBT22_13035 [Aliarcobacter sp.]|jgi:hypothetical protein|nr:hypothetical protein [Aliarcobacter sp.]
MRALAKFFASQQLNEIRELSNNSIDESGDLRTFILSNIESIKLLELVNHEYFHIFQTLQYHSCGVLYDSFRRLLDYKLNILVNYIQLDGKIKITYDDNIFSLLPKTKELDEDSYESLERWFSLIKNPINIIDYFFNSESKVSKLRVIDLVEGQAYIFQKLKSIGIDTFKLDNPIYEKAFSYFSKKQTNQDEILFLIFCHFSLKYGYVEQDSFSDLYPSPIDIFEYLCDTDEEYNIEIDDIRPRFFSSETISVLRNLGVDIEKHNILDIKRFLSSFEQDKLYLFSRILELLEKVEENVLKYFKKESVNFENYKNSSCKLDSFHDKKIATLYEEINLPQTDSFFVAVLIKNEILIETIHEPLLNLEFESFFGRTLNVEMDRAFSVFIDDVEKLMDGNKEIHCCEEHIPTKSFNEIANQRDEECFSNRFKLIFGKELKECFE